MISRTAFFTSRIARRFVVLFLFCAFLPTVALVILSYTQVMDQLEEQGIVRLKRETKSYSISLFDRMLRVDGDLQAIARIYLHEGQDYSGIPDNYRKSMEAMFDAVVIRYGNGQVRSLYQTIAAGTLEKLLHSSSFTNPAPFVAALPLGDEPARIFFGRQVAAGKIEVVTVIGQVRQSYLWGIGPNGLLPPMTELSVIDRAGRNIVATLHQTLVHFQEMDKHFVDEDLRVFTFADDGQEYYGSISNLFIESHFQPAGWTIILSQPKSFVFSAMKNFRQTFPFIILLFLLLSLYLSMWFIRRGLTPLVALKEGTARISRKNFDIPVAITSNDEFQELGDAFNQMAATLDKQFRTLAVLSEIDRAILSSLDRREIIATTLLRLREFFHCEISFFIKHSETAKDHVKIYFCQGSRHEDVQLRYLAISPEGADFLFVNREPCFPGRDENKTGFLDMLGGGRICSYLQLPITMNGTVDRVLLLGWKKDYLPNEDEITQGRKIAAQLAIALTNSLHLENLEKLATGTIEALARTVDAKSKWTAGHSERVALLGGRIGRVMGLSTRLIDSITRGGLLHDIGKIGIPVAILDKPGRLNDNEYREIQSHPAIGGKILEPIKAFADILPVITQHHEKFNGSGYPEGLRGEAIDIRARILAVADVWDALVSDRPYREGWIHDRAKNLIVEGAGAEFDPAVVEAFLAVIAEA